MQLVQMIKTPTRFENLKFKKLKKDYSKSLVFTTKKNVNLDNNSSLVAMPILWYV